MLTEKPSKAEFLSKHIRHVNLTGPITSFNAVLGDGRTYSCTHVILT